LALRGLQTLAVRLKEMECSALEVARWLSKRPEIEKVLHPALETCPGHDCWRRDFSGSSGVFSVVFDQSYGGPQVRRFVDALEFFKIGYSWAGVTSLVMPYDLTGRAGRPDYGARIVRLNIGLEEGADLIADLEQALAKMA
jgi:cystathionine beta-lyase